MRSLKGRVPLKDRKLVKYLIFAFVLAWPLQVVASFYALQGDLELFRLIMAGSARISRESSPV